MIDIVVQALSFSYRQLPVGSAPILADIDFHIRCGEFVVILGESGCGKSTMLELLAGLLTPSSGRILVDGKRLTRPDPAIALLFQESTLLPWLTVRQNIAFGCKLRRDTHNLEVRVARYMKMMGLSAYADYYPQALSVGMSKRVSLARLLVGKPKVLLLDEPFAPLDYFNKMRLQNELLDIWYNERFTCVFVTHDIEEAMQLGQRIMIMSNHPGRIEVIREVPLPYPRISTDSVFIDIKASLLTQFGVISHRGDE
jgi:ABC-type nitrate/sulfonate/bicarbonate transport system ATPase subunit